MKVFLLLTSFLVWIQLVSSFSVTSVSTGTTARLVWFRDHSLRVRDNDALYHAVNSMKNKTSVVPVYIWNASDEIDDGSPVDATTGGTASDVFLANALNGLNQTLFGKLSVGILIGEIQPEIYAEELARTCKNIGASEVYYMESYDPEFETSLKELLIQHNLTPCSFRGGYTLIDYSREEELPPWKEIISDHPFRSPLIPFVDYLLKRLKETPPSLPKPEPAGLQESIRIPISRVVTQPISIAKLLDRVGYTQTRTDWGSSIANAWPATETDATNALELFLESLPSSSGRDPDGECEPEAKRTHLASRLSPYLARGLLSPRQVYHALVPSSSGYAKKDRASFVRRICWRDYTYAVISLFPDVMRGRPIREGYHFDEEERAIDDGENGNILFELWKKGKTGFPLVDAGMRQLTKEGWMPQKVRLAASTCLVEGLGISWEEGMHHFAEYLVDYDVAINSNMWMNAGCVGFDPYYVGTDYKRRPYWDKDGDYVRQWCPELKDLPDTCEVAEAQRGIGTFKVDCLYEPWSSPQNVLYTAGVVLGESYPNRCCDERNERKRFFEKVRRIRSQWPSSLTDERGRDMVRLGRDPKCESIGMFTPRAFLVGKSRR